MRIYMTSTIASTTEAGSDASSSLLWLPYVSIASVCILFLAVNFCCYHRRTRLRYKRKTEQLETRLRVRERRVILRQVKAKNRIYLDNTQNDDVSEQSCTILANPLHSNAHAKPNNDRNECIL